MISGEKIKELVNEYADNPDNWDAFVNQWIEDNPDGVFEIISDYLENQINLPEYTDVDWDWYDFLENLVISDYEDAMEHKSDIAKEPK